MAVKGSFGGGHYNSKKRISSSALAVGICCISHSAQDVLFLFDPWMEGKVILQSSGGCTGSSR